MSSPETSDSEGSQSSPPKRSFADLINDCQSDPAKKTEIETVRKTFVSVVDDLKQVVALAPEAGIITDSAEKALKNCQQSLTILNTLASYAEENPNARVQNSSFKDVKPKHLDHMGIAAREVFPGQDLKQKLVALLDERGLAEPLGAFWTGTEEIPRIAQRFKFKRHILIGGLDILFNYVTGLEEACKVVGYTYPFVNVEQDVSIDAQAIITFDNPAIKVTQATFLYDNILVMPVIFKQTKKGPVWDKGDTENGEGELPKLMTDSQTFKTLIDENQAFFVFEVGSRRHLADPQDVYNTIARCLVLMQIFDKPSCCWAMTSGFDWVFGTISGDEQGRKMHRTSGTIPVKPKGYEKMELIWYLFACWFFIPVEKIEETLSTLPEASEDPSASETQADEEDSDEDVECKTQ